MEEKLRQIKKDKQIIKFSFYGLLKNLKFFEPFLLIYLISEDLSLFHIGVLFSVREIFNYIFEIPSGIFADNYGKKTELYICFALYMLSFLFFFIGGPYWMFIIAMIFFGMGEAFRSGTHKAIIMTYLEEKDWFSIKSMVYGRTRSFSLIGSAVSAVASIILVLSFKNYKILFLLCIIPYILDFLLIASYPKRFNEKHKTHFSIKDFFKESVAQLKGISKNPMIVRTVMSSSLFDAIFRSVKDYIQPILQAVVLTSSISLLKNLGSQDELNVYLGIVYGAVYILSAIASKNVYKLNSIKTSGFLMNVFFDVLAVVFILLAVFIKLNVVYVIIILYFMLYILKDARRPLFVDTIGDCMGRRDRVTVLSVESQFRALFMVILAPLCGFIADSLSVGWMFAMLGVFAFAVNRFVRIKDF